MLRFNGKILVSRTFSIKPSCSFLLSPFHAYCMYLTDPLWPGNRCEVLSDDKEIGASNKSPYYVMFHFQNICLNTVLIFYLLLGLRYVAYIRDINMLHCPGLSFNYRYCKYRMVLSTYEKNDISILNH